MTRPASYRDQHPERCCKNCRHMAYYRETICFCSLVLVTAESITLQHIRPNVVNPDRGLCDEWEAR